MEWELNLALQLVRFNLATTGPCLEEIKRLRRLVLAAKVVGGTRSQSALLRHTKGALQAMRCYLG